MNAARPLAWPLAMLAATACLPLVLGESRLFLTIDFLVMVLLAMSFNLLLGQGGLLSFGHATWYGLGAYAVAIATTRLGWPIWCGMLAAPVVAGLGAWLVGWFCVRAVGMYFAMLTLAFGQLLYTLVLGWYGFTGGDDGLPVRVPDWMLPATPYFYFCLGVVAVCLFLMWRIARSPFGMALGAIRENRQRAACLGLNVRALELRLFAIAGAFAGVAGALRAPLQQMAFPSLLHWSQSAEPVLIALAGGTGVFFGPVAGAALFVFTNFAITSHFEYPLMVFGTLVLAIVLFLPGGILGALATWRVRRGVKSTPGSRVKWP
ncbi:hypothetical protein GCM10023165_17050 [Variovorax defluvii]|uniref:Branched-chain amino acid ABC transporter permease n=1 Tax=Variovorax defluvii TaxID=913761 RepID=A0ABP8HEV7_9BURK